MKGILKYNQLHIASLETNIIVFGFNDIDQKTLHNNVSHNKQAMYHVPFPVWSNICSDVHLGHHGNIHFLVAAWYGGLHCCYFTGLVEGSTLVAAIHGRLQADKAKLLATGTHHVLTSLLVFNEQATGNASSACRAILDSNNFLLFTLLQNL